MTLVQTSTDPRAVGAVDDVTQEEINVLRELYPNLTLGELRIFGRVVKHTGLDPFSRQIFAVKRRQRVPGSDRWEEKMTVQTGIEGYRAIAERTGRFNGRTPMQYCADDGSTWLDAWPWREAPTGVRVGVYREGAPHPVYADAYLHEFIQTNRDGSPAGQWRTMPRVMLGKCAEAQALRAAFPNVYRGVYTTEEMGQADRDGAPAPLTVVQPVQAPQAASEAPKALPEATVTKLPAGPGVETQALRDLVKCGDKDQLIGWYRATMKMNYPQPVLLALSKTFVERCRKVGVPPESVRGAVKAEARS